MMFYAKKSFMEAASQKQALGCLSTDQSASLTGENLALIGLALPNACDLTPFPVRKLMSQLPVPKSLVSHPQLEPASQNSPSRRTIVSVVSVSLLHPPQPYWTTSDPLPLLVSRMT